MNEELTEKVEAYARHCNLQIGERLGFGLHGIVFAVKGQFQTAERAVKLHRFDEPYARERDVYARLMEFDLSVISGLRVPRLLRWDNEWLALEMTIVKPPYILDFASGFLDFAPSFPDDVWEDWEIKNREQFGDDWTRAQSVMADLREYGIYMLDPSPSNICFR